MMPTIHTQELDDQDTYRVLLGGGMPVSDCLQVDLDALGTASWSGTAGIASMAAAGLPFTAFAAMSERIIFNEIELEDGGTLPIQAIGFDVILEDDGSFSARDADLTVDACAPTRALLREEIADQLTFIWAQYGLADPAGLDPGAQRLRNRLRQLAA